MKFNFVDLQFKAIKDRNDIKGVIINVIPRDEHVEDIEQYFRVVKERAKYFWAMLPFENIPKSMLVYLLLMALFYVNAFSLKSGISDYLSPMTIVEGVMLDYLKHFKVIPRDYVQTFEGLENAMKGQTIGAITLGPSGNLQGGVQFFSLKSGLILNWNSNDF